jgi:hypothetical protein
MKHAPFVALLLFVSVVARAADIEISETRELPECHSINWVRTWVKDHPDVVGTGWEQLNDSAKPPANDAAPRNWIWNIPDDRWREAVAQRGQGKSEPLKIDLWVPEEAEVIRGVVAISRHGSGGALFRHPELRKIAQALHLALFMFEGASVQRGFWPKSWLFGELKRLGGQTGHPELEHAPLFLYGHSSGVGFSALFAAEQSDRVWGWVAMRPGYTFQIYQPGDVPQPR